MRFRGNFRNQNNTFRKKNVNKIFNINELKIKYRVEAMIKIHYHKVKVEVEVKIITKIKVVSIVTIQKELKNNKIIVK